MLTTRVSEMFYNNWLWVVIISNL